MSRFYLVEFRQRGTYWRPWRRDSRRRDAVANAREMASEDAVTAARAIAIDTDAGTMKLVWTSEGGEAR